MARLYDFGWSMPRDTGCGRRALNDDNDDDDDDRFFDIDARPARV